MRGVIGELRAGLIVTKETAVGGIGESKRACGCRGSKVSVGA